MIATAEQPIAPRLSAGDEATTLAGQWRKLTRAATAVAVLTSPAVFLWFHEQEGWNVGWSIVGAFLAIAAFRGFVDVVLRRLIPWPSLFGTDEDRVREEDVVNRRRASFWRFLARVSIWLLAFITLVFVYRVLRHGADSASWTAIAGQTLHSVQGLPGKLKGQLPLFFLLFLFNFGILFGPMLAMGISQMKAYEPGDAQWGVKLDDVRGQAEAKEEVRRVVNLWQSGDAFEQAGGRRERGLLFLGPPGTGKTMLSKAIATGFNSPFISMPGSGFAQTFIGMDVIIVRILAGKAKRLARKWGGQCIVFIDEIDAVGMRRASLGGGDVAGGSFSPTSPHDHLFYGPNGALNPSGDMVLESRAWRDRLFSERAGAPPSGSAALAQRVGGIANAVFPGMFGGGGQGSLALNQLLVIMDGIDNPPFLRRFSTRMVNLFLDATYVVPRRLGRASLRLSPPRPGKSQIYFVGATNVPIERLDPALIRPGRMGRHVWFRTPTKQDRLDVFDLYIRKVSHDEDLDRPERRDELARITNGYSPAMIEQVCSMALTIAHHTGRPNFSWNDIVEAMTTVESGTAVGVEYVPDETRAVALHEAGHAVAAHVYMKGAESTRLSIRMRAGSLGHHMALQKEERFSSWQSEEMGRLVWALGAMAAERVFYGENSNGVGGDVFSATAQAALMVGASAMGPRPVQITQNGIPWKREDEEQAREKVMKRFERIGNQIMNRTSGGGPFAENPIGSVLTDPHKRAATAQILGQAYMSAHHLIVHNKGAVEQIAEIVIERRELYGNELLDLLQDADLTVPQIDYTKDEAWPTI